MVRVSVIEHVLRVCDCKLTLRGRSAVMSNEMIAYPWQCPLLASTCTRFCARRRASNNGLVYDAELVNQTIDISRSHVAC
jgi:hypothetical protein